MRLLLSAAGRIPALGQQFPSRRPTGASGYGTNGDIAALTAYGDLAPGAGSNCAIRIRPAIHYCSFSLQSTFR
jgi:hypothetical protein